ncbi:DUF3316 domain-containing protein [Parabacteroides bouchesdurhonensis]|uniref:DUF3316 domain-containing protein n=1 Tax=Parabacteroides bouchesdurhonensis TaxID=1936995 RepID=UPI000C852831|nr:DUF3316 domain-containing protein [Parabacteroides bouchesdurhonensis]RHJ92101.1 DUF3316 domain-containing protein [Bacteroides sp. AM07-16]
MKQLALLISFFFYLSILPLMAQDGKNEDWSINEGTMVGAGRMHLMDTYLTPGIDINYSGWTLRIMDERLKRVKLANYNVTRQQIVSIDGGRTTNPSGSAIDYAFFLDYTLGYYYHFPVMPGLKLLAGSSGHLLGGCIYNTRNTNNPVSAKADIDLNLSGMAIYNLRIKNYPITFRYQLTVPFAGVSFAPHYNQSYYEMFGLGNHSGMVQFNSFHNKFAMKHYITADFPVGKLTIRMGYLNSRYQTDMNSIDSHIITHTFMLGFVKEFVSFGGKRAMNNKHTYKSTYY